MGVACFEINGNLADADGVPYFNSFKNTICSVWRLFESVFGIELMSRIPLYIDNARAKSGRTPMCTLVLGRYIVIKLGVDSGLDTARIIYQFAHELMHFTMHCYYGMSKQHVTKEEEAVCVAASLLALKELNADVLEDYIADLRNSPGYADGVAVGESCGYDWQQLRCLALQLYPWSM